MGRVLKQSDIRVVLPLEKGQKRLVFTNGCFDLVHRGHLEYLREAKSLGDLLFVGINSDASVKRLKGPKRPIQNQEDRAALLAALDFVDYVCVFDEDTPEKMIHAVRPDVLVKGGDWTVDKIVGGDFVIANGGQVRSLKFIEGQSTTSIIERVLEAYSK